MKKSHKSKEMILEIGNMTHMGMVREKNQDYYGTYDTVNGKLVIVCDGMGGYQGGEIASQLAVETVKQVISSEMTDNIHHLILSALHRAHQVIKEKQGEDSALSDMGTTIVMLLVKEHQFWFAHVGDSRIYLLRQGELQRLNKDHSLVQQMIDGGLISEEQARSHPKKNIITRALGAKDGTPDVSGPYSVFQGDKFLLCTDGMYGYFNDSEIQEILKRETQNACSEFVSISNQRGGDDNITVQIVNVVKGNNPIAFNKTGKVKTYFLLVKRNLSYILLSLLICLSLVLTFLLYQQSARDKQEIKKIPIKKNEKKLVNQKTLADSLMNEKEKNNDKSQPPAVTSDNENEIQESKDDKVKETNKEQASSLNNAKDKKKGQ
ncbi:MAG TPA: Stp1/IreP family PP2C-type Ser/Thr phosphatase [Candidatus Cloacimonadota bacterium]|nr:Stp1/IreP family PP2C-type Ser/Thr phosphatase [Candidatus Cloacimonadota bacterium]